jgi:hypothetical protein
MSPRLNTIVALFIDGCAMRTIPVLDHVLREPARLYLIGS